MKKRKIGRTLSRTSDQRLALKRTMLTSLILHKKITTTLAKAKELRPFAEKMVTRAKKTTVSSKDQAVLRLLQKDISKKAADGLIAIAETFASRNGGYTRILKLAPRKSDGAQMAIMEWVGMEKEKKEDPKAKKGKASPVPSSAKASKSKKTAKDNKVTEDKYDKK